MALFLGNLVYNIAQICPRKVFHFSHVVTILLYSKIFVVYLYFLAFCGCSHFIFMSEIETDQYIYFFECFAELVCHKALK